MVQKNCPISKRGAINMPDKITEQEMEEYLFLRGWMQHERPFRNKIIKMWSHPRSGSTGMPTEMAYREETWHEEKEKRTADLKAGKPDVFCNKCGENLKFLAKDYEGKDFFVGYYGLVDAHVSGGYLSKHLRDLQYYEFSLCEKCIKEMFDTFKVPPKQERYL